MGKQGRWRNARREFPKAYPEIGTQVAEQNKLAARRFVISGYVRNAIIAAAGVLFLYWRCAP